MLCSFGLVNSCLPCLRHGIASKNTSEVVNTTRDFEKIFCTSSSQVVKKMAAKINKLDGKNVQQIGINNI